MGRENIYNTLCVSSVMPKNTISGLMDYLIDNRAYLLPSTNTAEAFKTRFSGNSLLSEIVHRLNALGKDSEYTLLKLPSKSVSLREVVDMTFVPFDILQMKNAIDTVPKVLSVLPELNDKMIINVTDILKANNTFSDISQFQYRVVRDFLSRSFYNSTGSSWVSPTFVRYIAKVYNMTIGGEISRVFGLSQLVQMFIQTIFCLFFVGKMTSSATAPDFLKIHGKYMNIATNNELVQILAFVEDTLGKKTPENLIEVCAVIDAYGHEQLIGPNGTSRLTLPVLKTRFMALYPDTHVSMIAMEYPPYFAFLMLLVLSHVRIKLSFNMKQMNILKEGQEIFNQLVKSSLFLNGM